MSKRKQRRDAVQQAEPVIAAKKEKTTATGRGLNSMTNWLVVLLLLLPLAYSTATMDPLLSVRYIILSVFLLFFILYFLWYRQQASQLPLPFLNKIVFALGLVYSIWMIVCMSGALNFREGYYETGKQLLTLLYLFAVMLTVMKEENQLMKLFYVLVVAALLHSLIGIMQFYESGFTEIPGANSKPFGMMANRNLYGSALMLLLPFVLYVVHRGSLAWKIIASATLGLQVFALLLSQTRSAWVAVMVIFIVSLSLVLLFSPANRRKWLLGSAGVIAGSALIIFLVLAGDSEGELKQSVKERTQSITSGVNEKNESRGNVQERFRIWDKTIALIKDKPLTGAGPGNWKITIAEYGTRGLAWAGGMYAPDRVHNVYLQVAAETGLPGAVIYFSMWLLILLVAIKLIRKPKNEDQRILVILMLAGLVGLAADAMFSFPTERFEHTLFFYGMAGIILGLYANNTVTEKKLALSKPFIIGLGAICLLNLLLAFAKYNFEVHWQKGKAFENAGMYADMLREFEKGKSSFVTLGPDAGAPLELKTAIALKELKQYDRAMREIDKAWQYHPNSAAVWNTLGTIHTDVGQFEKAVAAYEQGLKIAPQYDIVLKNLAVNYYNLNRFKDCYQALLQVDVTNDAMLQQMKDYSKQMAGDSVLNK